MSQKHTSPLRRFLRSISRIFSPFHAVFSRFFLAVLRIRLRFSTLRARWARQAPSLPQLPRPNRTVTAALCFAVLFALPAAVAMRPGLRMSVDGRTIGFVACEADAAQAVEAVEASVSAFTGKPYKLECSMELTPDLAFASQLASAGDAAALLAEAADGVDLLAVLTVDGETIGACATAEEIQQTLDDTLERYKTSEDDTARFTENVNVTMAAAPSDALVSAETLRGQLAGKLDVEVTSSMEYTEAIPYETLWVENEQMDQNTTQVIKDGTDGEAKVEAEVVTLNGVETSRTIVSRAVLSRATNAVVAVGTRNVGIGTGEFMIPVTSYTYTSGFKYRWGRWHKGADLAVPSGTPVYAADNGKVIVSEWSDSYGSYIIIDHQNGLKTLYAHNSILLVSVGDTIAKGTQIALSGNTGNSTGPHLHFEVHHNGTAVNPELYVALGAPTSIE